MDMVMWGGEEGWRSRWKNMGMRINAVYGEKRFEAGNYGLLWLWLWLSSGSEFEISSWCGLRRVM